MQLYTLVSTWLYVIYVVGLLEKAAVTDYDDSSIQVTSTSDCMPSDPLSKSHPAAGSTTTAAGRQPAPSQLNLSSSWPLQKRSPLSGLSERTKRLLGRVSPEKLLASAGVSLSDHLLSIWLRLFFTSTLTESVHIHPSTLCFYPLL